MSGTAVTRIFETEFAEWIGRKHALAYPNGTVRARPGRLSAFSVFHSK
jgi:dTDP-4-amino-4,6-dideoxygalactose transaminase